MQVQATRVITSRREFARLWYRVQLAEQERIMNPLRRSVEILHEKLGEPGSVPENLSEQELAAMLVAYNEALAARSQLLAEYRTPR